MWRLHSFGSLLGSCGLIPECTTSPYNPECPAIGIQAAPTAASAGQGRMRSCSRWGLLLASIGDGRAATAVILNSDDNSISLIDTATYKETSRVHIGRAPHHLIRTPDGRDLIVAMAGGNELVFLDPETGALKRRLTGVADPYQVGFSPDRKWFVTTSLRLDRVDIYDAADFTLRYRLPASSRPSHIAFAADSSRVYITVQDTDRLMAIDLTTGKPVWNAVVGSQPAGVITTRSGNLLVGIMGSDNVAEVDAKDGAVLRRIHTGRGAHNFLVSPDGKSIYVTNRVAGTISVLDPESLAITRSFTAPGGPDDMAVSPDSKELWVTGRWRAAVNVIDISTGVMKTSIPVGRSPHGIYIDLGE